MKEKISEINNEDYHRIVYPSIVSGDNILQKDIFGEFWVLPNPERFSQPKQQDKPREYTIIKTRGVQSAFHPFGSHNGRR